MKRIPSLDGLRAISISLVILSHLSGWHHIRLNVPIAYGELGVQIFFVLSGYLITGILLRERERTTNISLRNFYLRRAFRLFPAAFVFITIAAVVYWREMRWFHIAAALLYVSNMDLARPGIFVHLWSLGIEEQFYLLWPFVLKKWFRQKTIILLAVLLLITPLFQVGILALKIQSGIIASLPAYADYLAAGCLLAILEKRLPKIPRWAALLMVIAMVLIPSFPAINPARTLFELFLLRPLLDLSIAGVVLHVTQFPYRALNWAPVAWLGRISYSLYLWQEPFCANHGTAYHLGYLLIIPSVACACLSYYLVEQPMLRLREKL